MESFSTMVDRATTKQMISTLNLNLKNGFNFNSNILINYFFTEQYSGNLVFFQHANSTKSFGQ